MSSSQIVDARTYKILNDHPELAGNILLARLCRRFIELHAHGERFDQDNIRNLVSHARSSLSRNKLKQLLAPQQFEQVMTIRLIFGWIYAQRPITTRAAKQLLRVVTDLFMRATILWWAGKQGRPVILREAAIRALIRREYLEKPWLEITRRVCPCGRRHVGTDCTNRAKAECQPKLETEVRILKHLLRDCRIALPKYLRIFDDGQIRLLMESDDARASGCLMVSPANDSAESQELVLDLAKRFARWRSKSRPQRSKPNK
jgi:hypothetical protein